MSEKNKYADFISKPLSELARAITASNVMPAEDESRLAMEAEKLHKEMVEMSIALKEAYSKSIANIHLIPPHYANVLSMPGRHEVIVEPFIDRDRKVKYDVTLSNGSTTEYEKLEDFMPKLAKEASEYAANYILENYGGSIDKYRASESLSKAKSERVASASTMSPFDHFAERARQVFDGLFDSENNLSRKDRKNGSSRDDSLDGMNR